MMVEWKEHKLRYAINGNFIFLKVNLSVMSLGSVREMKVDGEPRELTLKRCDMGISNGCWCKRGKNRLIPNSLPVCDA